MAQRKRGEKSLYRDDDVDGGGGCVENAWKETKSKKNNERKAKQKFA